MQTIPPFATLIFEIILVDIEDELPMDVLTNKNVFKAMDANKDNVITREEVHN